MGEEQMTRDAGMAVREGETAREQAQAQTPEPTPVRVQMPEQTAVPGQMAGQTQADAAKQEQEVSDNGEDMLLEQIDAFRDKAKQLQNLISAKERKVKELEALVRAKEEKNQALREQNVRLQEELNKKKAKADGWLPMWRARWTACCSPCKESSAECSRRFSIRCSTRRSRLPSGPARWRIRWLRPGRTCSRSTAGWNASTAG